MIRPGLGMGFPGRNAAEFRSVGAPSAPGASRGGGFATGGLAGALLASSCCTIPLGLALAGIGGAWVGYLTTLEPYRPWFIGLAVALVGAGHWQLHVRKRATCAAGSDCQPSRSGRAAKITLWLATAIVLQAATIDLWAPLLY